jgi:type I restriction enzyme S subunit
MSRQDTPNSKSLLPASDIPLGWTVARLDDIATLINGFTFTPRQWKQTGLPIVRIQNLNDPDAPFNYCEDDLPAKFRITTGELLFAWSGTPGTSFGAHIWQGGDAWLNQHIFKIVFDRDLVNADFLCLAINNNLQSYISDAQGGSGLAHITKTTFSASLIMLAPLNEQVRIVQKIEELTGDIDEGATALERARSNIIRYKLDILIGGADGTLTHNWRQQHPLNTASAVSNRLSNPTSGHRRGRASSQLNIDFLDRSPARSNPSDTSGFSLLWKIPDTWRWITVEQAGELTIGRQRSPKDHTGPYMRPYLRVANVFEDRIDTSDVLSMNFTPEEFTKYRLEQGDILLNEGQSLELVGRAAMYQGEIPDVCFQNTLIRFRAASAVVPDFALIVFRAYLHSQQFQRIAKRTTNIAHLSLSRLATLEFPLPPLAEQQYIADTVKQRLLQLNMSEHSVSEGLASSRLLRARILSQAFTGTLVKQHANDEPAAVLVERIRQRRANKAENISSATPEKRKRPIRPGGNIVSSTSKRPLLPILRDHPKGLTPEELLSAAGYDLTEIDDFYEQLRAVQAYVTESRASGTRIHSWPNTASITLRIKE